MPAISAALRRFPLAIGIASRKRPRRSFVNRRADRPAGCKGRAFSLAGRTARTGVAGAGLSLNVMLLSRWRVLRPFGLNVLSKVAQFRVSQHGAFSDRPAL